MCERTFNKLFTSWLKQNSFLLIASARQDVTGYLIRFSQYIHYQVIIVYKSASTENIDLFLNRFCVTLGKQHVFSSFNVDLHLIMLLTRTSSQNTVKKNKKKKTNQKNLYTMTNNIFTMQKQPIKTFSPTVNNSVQTNFKI